MRNFDIALGRDKDYDILLPRHVYGVQLPIYTLPFRMSVFGRNSLILTALAWCSLLRKFLNTPKNVLRLGSAAPSPRMTKYARAMSGVALNTVGRAASHTFQTAKNSAVRLGCDAHVLGRPLAAGGNTIALWQSGAQLGSKGSLGAMQADGLELSAAAPATEYASSMHADSSVKIGAKAKTICARTESGTAGSAIALGMSGCVSTELRRLRRLYELDDMALSDMDEKTLMELDYVIIEDQDDMSLQSAIDG